LWTKIGSRETWKTYFDGWSCWLPPTAFVCCSRGGKTRALIEIAQRLKSSVDTSVIFVSFNAFSNIQRWEQENPLGALCRRIAFAARRERNATFQEDFANADVKPAQIIKWLGRNPRILLIDELNLCTSLSDKSNSSTDFANFLKRHFLEKENQYFVFSSHVVSTVEKLSTYLDSVSDRSIIIRELPLIRSVLNATKIFDWPQLNARQALFYGLVPAMIHFASIKEQEKKGYVLPYWKRIVAIKECIKDGLVTNESVRRLLASFVDGDRFKVMEPLHQLMNTGENGKLRWIPYHMTEVLRIVVQEVPSLDENLKKAMRDIVNLFYEFSTVQESSGMAWENLFLLVVIIRVMSRQFDKVILPLDFSMDYSISFNEFYRYDKEPMVRIIKVDKFVKGFTEPDRYPHVAIKKSTNALFPVFDLIIAVYDKASSRKIYAYQLKEGREIPKRNTSRLGSTEFDACVLVRGQPQQGETRSTDQWIIPSKSQIEDFFGESGKHWTPEEWKKLMEKEK